MISDRYENYLKRLLTKTNSRKIKWRPIYEYIETDLGLNAYPDRVYSSIQDYIRNVNSSCLELYLDKSFFVQKNGYVLALLNYRETDHNENVHDVLELVGGIYNTPIKQIPEYIDGGFSLIQDAIIQYWQSKEGDYNLDISDSFEILSAFTEED